MLKLETRRLVRKTPCLRLARMWVRKTPCLRLGANEILKLSSELADGEMLKLEYNILSFSQNYFKIIVIVYILAE